MGRSLARASLMFLVLMTSSAAPQDIPGLEVCTAEKQMERRTGCLQSNDEFLQRALSKLTLETQAKLSASSRALATAQAEIVVLKSGMEELKSELVRVKEKLEPASK